MKCSADMCKKCEGLVDGANVYEADDVFIRQMHIKNKETFVPQHSHEYDHVSMLAVGSVRVWADNVLVGDRTAPVGIVIKAGVKHTFMSLEDNTIIYCVHNVSRTGKPEIREEHQLTFGDI